MSKFRFAFPYLLPLLLAVSFLAPGRCVALHQALLNHKVNHEFYVAGHGGHGWATWRNLLYSRFLPNLWRKQ